MSKQEKPIRCPYIFHRTCPLDEPHTPWARCTSCLLATINEKLDSGAELEKKLVDAYLDFLKLIMKQVKKDRRKKP